MKVYMIKMECDCEHTIVFYSASGKCQQQVHVCPHCHKTWEVKNVRIELKEDEVKKLRRRAINILFENGWSREKIWDLIYSDNLFTEFDEILKNLK